MPLLERRQQVAVKQESTEGTAETLAATNAAFNTFEVSYSPDIQQFERNPNRLTIGSLASLAGVRLGRVTMTTELVGSGDGGTPTPPWDPIILSCGFQKITSLLKLSITSPSGFYTVGETVTGPGGGTGIVVRTNQTGDNTIVVTQDSGTFTTEVITGQTSGVSGASGAPVAVDSVAYRPDSSANKSYTVGVYQDGLRHIIKGARGNVRFSGAVGEPVQMQVEYVGAIESTSDASLLSGVVYPTSVPPQLLGVGLQFGGYAPVFENISIDTGNSLNPRRNANDASGVISTLITSRAVTGSMDPESTLIGSNEDWFAKLQASTQTAMSMQIGTASGNRFGIGGPNAQYANISGGSRNELLTHNLDLRLNELAGDDDLIISCEGDNT